jgi:hypothetical protein
MKIIYERVPRTTLQDFVEKHNLSILVTEREKPSRPEHRFCARIPDSEVVRGTMLAGVFGGGATEEAAIRDYVPHISGQKLKIATTYIDVPVLLPYVADEAVGVAGDKA